MPQLDIVYILMTLSWTWVTLIIMTHKIKLTTMNNKPTTPLQDNKTEPMTMLPWT